MNKKIKFTAHINPVNGEEQSCQNHCINTAKYAEGNLKCINLGHAGYFAGIMHDAGKFTKEFNKYIHDSAAGKPVRKGSVIHTFTAVSWLLNTYHQEDASISITDICAEILAYAVGAHHGNFDCIDEYGKSGFEHRLEKQPEYDNKAMSNFFQECISEEEINDLFNEAEAELTAALNVLSGIPESDELERNNEEVYFYEGMLARLILSAVIDGDRRDTAEFMTGRDFSKIIRTDGTFWEKIEKSLERHLNGLPSDTPIQKAREELSVYCGQFAGNESGVYRLNLPTGAGKTLSALRFAVSHAWQKSKKRIIYVAPLISILDQNADVIRNALGREDIVLEHHSNVIMDEAEHDELNQYELLAETWDAPVIVTTLVQFMNTLLSGKTTSIRRFQSLCDSVIILDEVQTIPLEYISLFNLAVNFLAEVCHATVLLCSATQPCLEQADHPMKISRKYFIPEEKYSDYIQVFERTEVNYGGRLKLTEIPDFILKEILNNESILVICNKKSEAEKLYQTVKEKTEVLVFHLSSAMCMAHRKSVLRKMYDALERHKKMICISTQVIEAGVDISFSEVIRLAAGLDRIVQSAGRCNRNGESDHFAPVYILDCADESLKHLPSIQKEKNAFLDMLNAYQHEPEKFSGKLTSTEAVNYYYRSLYHSMILHEQDGCVNSDYPSLFELLSDNETYSEKCRNENYKSHFMTRQAFRTAGRLFQVIDNEAETVIVPYDNEAEGLFGSNLIALLSSEKAERDLFYRKQLIHRAREYSVSIYSYQAEKLRKEGGIKELGDGLMILLPEYYDQNIGLTEKGGHDGCTLIL